MRQTRFIVPAFATVVQSALFIYFSACTREPVYIGSLDNDPVDTTGGGGTGIPCDPDSVYFNQQILPILTSNCAMSGCHDAASHEEGVVLDNYNNVRATGKIDLTTPTNSKLCKVLNKTDPEDRMPPAPMAALPIEQRALILKWIQQGALNLSCDSGCDTTNVAFTATVMPLITLKCKGCHSGSTPHGNVSLTNYNEVKATVIDGTLLGSIEYVSGYKPMPYPAGSNKMPNCEIRSIQIWVENGAPNN